MSQEINPVSKSLGALEQNYKHLSSALMEHRRNSHEQFETLDKKLDTLMVQMTVLTAPEGVIENLKKGVNDYKKDRATGIKALVLAALAGGGGGVGVTQIVNNILKNFTFGG